MSKEVEISEPSLKDRIVLQGKKIKDHVEENKWVYIGGVLVVLSRGYFKPKMAPTITVAEIVTHNRPVGVLSKQLLTTNIVKIYSMVLDVREISAIWKEDRDRLCLSNRSCKNLWSDRQSDIPTLEWTSSRD